jgi:hypothetical protein
MMNGEWFEGALGPRPDGQFGQIWVLNIKILNIKYL